MEWGSTAFWVPWILVAAKAALILSALIFLVSGLDDFLVDLGYFARVLYRRWFVRPSHKRLSVEQLVQHPEQPIALMIPAWDESKVIRGMLENSLRSINYSNYQIFVGCYPNDPDTLEEVQSVAADAPNVYAVICERPGPTSKADCLNQVYRRILQFERERGMVFAAFVIDDAEDIVHPLSLKMFNYLIPRKDMVQLPVLPLEAAWYEFTAGHYMDEFAENHSKDMVFRESFARSIPCAGTGCAFSRRAMERLAEHGKGQIFEMASVTEDYEVGYLLGRLGLKGIFVRHAVERNVSAKSSWSQEAKSRTVDEYIATREFFPRNFRQAVRQKSRWVLGITLQAWKRLGWRWPVPVAYMLLRDRKALLTNQINMLGYVVLVIVCAVWLNNRLLPESYHFPPLVEAGSWLWYLILVDLGFLIWRLVIRGYYVYRAYGLLQALLSPLRMVWGNVINFAATARALYTFVASPLTGRKITWEKTDHRFPTEAELTVHRRRLGELLLDRKLITVSQLDAALERQRERQLPLGKVLVEMGLIEEDSLVRVLGTQLHVETREIDPREVPAEALEALPRRLALKYSVFPLELRGDKLLVCAEDLLTKEELNELEAALGRPVEVCLAGTSDLAFAIRRGYQAPEAGAERAQPGLLGERLVQDGLITREDLNEALRLQRRSYMRLGDVLLREKMLSPAQLQEALEGYFETEGGRLGDYLLAEGWVSGEQMSRALQGQRERFKRLGEVLVEMRTLTQGQIQTYLRDYRL